MSKARITYCTKGCKHSGYKVEIKDGEQWKMTDFYKLNRRENAPDDEARLYIRADIINTIK